MGLLEVSEENGICNVVLKRPDVRNAFDEHSIKEITHVFQTIRPRVAIISGAGKVFCAGGDLDWMKRSVDLSQEENERDANSLSKMFQTIDEAPFPVVGKVHGAAFGGGVGMVCVCDVVVAETQTKFCFSEARLGLAPAVIAPYAISKIGLSQARRFFQTAEVFDSKCAKEIGLVHEVAVEADLDRCVSKICHSIIENGPLAVNATKKLIRKVATSTREEASLYCAKTIAALRISSEGQEGVRAFLEKRSPDWK